MFAAWRLVVADWRTQYGAHLEDDLQAMTARQFETYLLGLLTTRTRISAYLQRQETPDDR